MGQVLSLLPSHPLQKRSLSLYALIAMYIYMNKHKKKSRKKFVMTDDDGKLSKEAIAKFGKAEMWRIFTPTSLTSEGSFELIVIACFHIIRVYQNLQLTNLVRIGDRVIFNRNANDYWANQWAHTRLAIQMVFCRHVSDYLKKRLSLQWKARLTRKMHEKYFDQANYYHIENMIKDADSRMTEEVEKVADGFTEFLNAGVFNLSTGIFYLGKLWYEYGFIYAFAPAIYIWIANATARKIAPLDYSLFGPLAQFKAGYRNAQTRMVVHSEAISALRGAEREKDILHGVFARMVAMQRRVHAALVPHSVSIEFLVHRLMWTGVGWAVVGRGVFDPPTATSQTIAAISEVRAEVGYQFILYIQVVVAALYGSGALTEYFKLGGEAGRIYELMHTLDLLSERKKQQGQTFFRRGNAIAFKDADIRTPTGHLLVKNLSFEVTDQNDSLLLTGHNGAGKSSIFRCLAGIWKIDKGEITKPIGGTEGKAGDPSLSGDVFYLPQKPYNVIGTLIDQLTYPQAAAESAQLEEAYVRKILALVELEYLVDREGVFERDINWEDELSLGEKQRLAIARVIHHNPRFAILDECTSGVATAMERRLYHLLNERNISYITISHRPVLEQMHCKSLCINGDDEKSYTYKVLRTPEQLHAGLAADAASDGASGGGVNTEELRINLKAQRSSRYDSIPALRKVRLARMRDAFGSDSAIANLRLVLAGAMPSGWQTKAAFILAGIVGKAVLTDMGLLNGAGLFRALFQRDRSLLYRVMAVGVMLALADTLANQYTKFFQKKLQVDLLESLTNKYMAKYVNKAGFYGLKNIDGRITDAETRLSDDMDEFVTMLSSLMMDVIDPIFNVLWLGRRLAVTIGITNAGSLYAYLFACACVSKIIMPDFKSMVARKNEADGRLKFTHSTIRTHSESIAFFGGGLREKALVWKRFESVLQSDRKKLWSDLWFSWFKGFFVTEMPHCLQQHLRFKYAVDNFDDAKILADGGSDLALGQHMIWGVQNTVKRSIQEIVEVSDKFNNLSGVIARLAELDSTLDDLQLPPFMKDERRNAVTAMRASGSKPERPTLTIKNLDIVTPCGQCVGAGIDLVINCRNRLLVTGPNASGKTSFFRVLGGLWPAHPQGEVAGSVELEGDMFLVPQRVYSVVGTLLDQVTYPEKIKEEDVDEELLAKALKLLDLVGIAFLVKRDGGWHVERKFEDVLSLGEQQRLGMARLFYRNPCFAVLDECTDAVSQDVEERLYTTAMDMGITCITISKRLALENFHEHELRLGEATEDGCSIHRMSHRSNSTGSSPTSEGSGELL